MEQLEVLSRETDNSGDLIAAVMRMPDVIGSSKNEISEEEWRFLKDLIVEALEKLESFRIQEGTSISKDFEQD